MLHHSSSNIFEKQGLDPPHHPESSHIFIYVNLPAPDYSHTSTVMPFICGLVQPQPDVHGRQQLAVPPCCRAASGIGSLRPSATDVTSVADGRAVPTSPREHSPTGVPPPRSARRSARRLLIYSRCRVGVNCGGCGRLQAVVVVAERSAGLCQGRPAHLRRRRLPYLERDRRQVTEVNLRSGTGEAGRVDMGCGGTW